jgi:hypothetical protein
MARSAQPGGPNHGGSETFRRNNPGDENDRGFLAFDDWAT